MLYEYVVDGGDRDDDGDASADADADAHDADDDGRKHILTVASVGDSSCVLCKAGKAFVVTPLHRLSDEDEKNRVLAAGGKILKSRCVDMMTMTIIINFCALIIMPCYLSPNRVNGVLAVTRAFGDVQFKPANVPAESHCIIATPSLFSEVVTPQTEFALIATDGLFDVIEPQAAVTFVKRALSKRADLETAATALCKEAISVGSVDNVSVALVAFHCA